MRLRSMFYAMAVIFLLSATMLPAAQGKVIYVDDDAAAPGDGTSWATAYRFLQDALTDAAVGREPVEIRVAQGLYKPDQSASRPDGTRDRGATFCLAHQLTLRGGYAGAGTSDPNAWEPEIYQTVLSGDLASDDVELASPLDAGDAPSRLDNSYNVISGDEDGVVVGDLTATLEGLVTTAGHAFYEKNAGGPSYRTQSEHVGGGLNLKFWTQTPTLKVTVCRCVFRDNYAEEGGGAIYADWTDDLSLIDCWIVANGSRGSGGGLFAMDGGTQLLNCHFERNASDFEGGGIACHGNELRLTSCTLTNNATSRVGGGMAISGGPTKLFDCVLRENRVEGMGGGIDLRGAGSLDAVRCRFVSNQAGNRGGAIKTSIDDRANLEDCMLCGNTAGDTGGGVWRVLGELTMVNCTAFENRAPEGGTIFDHTSLEIGAYQRGHVSIRNSIIVGNGAHISNDFGQMTIEYTSVAGRLSAIADSSGLVVWGVGNVDADPCFVDPGYWDMNGTPDDPNDDFYVEGDYHLKSQAGRWDPNSASWVIDDVTSPCIDAGDPNSDFSGEVWPHGGRINMGAYGGTAQASMSAEPTEMALPHIACIHWYNSEKAESFQSFLQAHGCSVTLIRSDRLGEHALDGYDLIMIATDTTSPAVWADEQAVTTLVESGKPILGLGEGGYRFFGKLGLTIGYPNGASTTHDSIHVLDPNSALFGTPYAIDVPADGVLQLYGDAVGGAMIYLWPTPETVTTLGSMVGDSGYFPLLAERGHLLWGFAESPEQMTETGRRLFLNAVILTANGVLEPQNASSP